MSLCYGTPQTYSPVSRSQVGVQGRGHNYVRQELCRCVPSITGFPDTVSLFTPAAELNPTRILCKSYSMYQLHKRIFEYVGQTDFITLDVKQKQDERHISRLRVLTQSAPYSMVRKKKRSETMLSIHRCLPVSHQRDPLTKGEISIRLHERKYEIDARSWPASHQSSTGVCRKGCDPLQNGDSSSGLCHIEHPPPLLCF